MKNLCLLTLFLFGSTLVNDLARADSPAPSQPRVSARSAASQGRVTPTTVRMTAMTAEVRIQGMVATTTLHQVLHNDGRRQAEANWLLPLPEGAVADGFKMTAGGVEMTGEVLDAKDARQVYESIVRARRDPGLLEYIDRGCLRAHVFPIPAGGDVAVEVTWRQLLPSQGGLQQWSFPIQQAGLHGRAPEQFVLDMTIETERPLKNVFSPTSRVHVRKTSEFAAQLSFEAKAAGLPGEELAVYYGSGEQDFGLDLLSHHALDEAEGSFLMLISPKRDWQASSLMKKEILFVLDTSGSMEGHKIEQAKNALVQFLGSLHPEDRFNVVPFSTGADPFFDAPVQATKLNISKAKLRAARIRAEGGTNIAGALEVALDVPRSSAADGTQHVPIVVFLTDGMPTVGERTPARILAGLERWNQRGTRIFVLGVGADVNIPLLDKLAERSHGTRDYVRESESIEAKTSALFHKLANPVMTDLEVLVDGVEVSRQVPSRLPDLFQGDRLSVLGRFVGQGRHSIRLTGMLRGERTTFVYEGDFSAEPHPERDFIASLWAERRVAVLLDEIRLNGHAAELFDEVVRLGRRYNIVTPYTSHLIVEEGLAVAGGGTARRAGSTPTTGSGATPRTPGTGSPASPGSPAPRTPGSPAGGWARGHGGTYRGPGDLSPPAPRNDLEWIVERLLAAGVLPADAPAEELEQLALEIAAELRASESSLRGLGSSDTGKDAVDDSTYLADLIRGGEAAGKGTESAAERRKATQQALLALFSRRIGTKHFDLRAGVWTDRSYDEARMAKAKRTLEAYSKAYFDLLKDAPELAPYLALSDRLLIVHAGEVIEVRATAPAPKDARD